MDPRPAQVRLKAGVYMSVREYWGQQWQTWPWVNTGGSGLGGEVRCQGNEKPVGDNAEGISMEELRVAGS